MDVSTRQLPLEQQVSRAVELFLRVRWLPPLVIIFGGLLLVYILGLQLSLLPLFLIAAGIFAANVGFSLYYSRSKPNDIKSLLHFAQLQMIVDFAAITFLVHYTGGVLSPLIWFYAIHLLIGCIFFKRLRVAINMGTVWLALAVMLIAEHIGLIRCFCLFPDVTSSLRTSPGFLVIVLGSNAIGWGILIWLVTLITERVRAAEREDRQLQLQLAGTLEELQASEKERMLYRRTMTHELRSPITATQSMLRLLVSGHMGPLEKKQMGMVRKSLVRLDQMMSMLQDLLDLERGKSQGVEVTTFRLKPMMAELITVYYPTIEEAEMSLEVQIDNEITAFGNPGDIKSILSNLISNAVKYNRTGGAIRIKVTPIDTKVEISVADSGIGIPEAAKEKLFTEFFRAQNAKSHNPYGTGLGLAIVHSLVRKNNGDIHVDSEEGKGTVFTLTLPRIEPA